MLTQFIIDNIIIIIIIIIIFLIMFPLRIVQSAGAAPLLRSKTPTQRMSWL